MNRVIIIGAGGHAAEIADYINFSSNREDNQLKIIGLLDDNPESYKCYGFEAPFLGNIKEHMIRKDVSYLMGIANLKYRKPIIQDFLLKGAEFLTFVHPTATISRTVEIGIGSIIGPYVNLGPNVRVGTFNLINSRCSLGHDTKIGDYNFISPNVCFSGFTKIGDENLFGINSATIPNVRVGNKNKIAAGMVIDQNIKDSEVVFYRFKERVIAIPRS